MEFVYFARILIVVTIALAKLSFKSLSFLNKEN